MAYSAEIREQARTYYCRNAVTCQQAAAYIKVSVPTFMSWKKKAKADGDDWDLHRQAKRLASGGMGDLTTEVLEDFSVQFKHVMESLRNDKELPAVERAETLAKLSDAYVKTINAASKSHAGLNHLAAALEVLEDLATFVQTTYPHFAESFLEILEPFGAELSKKHG